MPWETRTSKGDQIRQLWTGVMLRFGRAHRTHFILKLSWAGAGVSAAEKEPRQSSLPQWWFLTYSSILLSLRGVPGFLNRRGLGTGKGGYTEKGAVVWHLT